jgi:hypothetical protein
MKKKLSRKTQQAVIDFNQMIQRSVNKKCKMHVYMREIEIETERYIYIERERYIYI